MDLPPDLSEQARRAVMVSLVETDRYGHDRTRHGAVVWAELDHRSST
ncbi:hypothetical protein [Streptomyces cinnamoneus]|nr:hypothetical protein [Streptomyces cinnamoneus]